MVIMRMWIVLMVVRFVYEAGGGTSGIDFDGTENTFILDASSEFDFFGLVMIRTTQMILK